MSVLGVRQCEDAAWGRACRGGRGGQAAPVWWRAAGGSGGALERGALEPHLHLHRGLHHGQELLEGRGAHTKGTATWRSLLGLKTLLGRRSLAGWHTDRQRMNTQRPTRAQRAAAGALSRLGSGTVGRAANCLLQPSCPHIYPITHTWSTQQEHPSAPTLSSCALATRSLCRQGPAAGAAPAYVIRRPAVRIARPWQRVGKLAFDWRLLAENGVHSDRQPRTRQATAARF